MIIIMVVNKILPNDYLCKCGALLHNTCKSAIKKHKKTKRHYDKMNGIIKETPPMKTEFKKEHIVITFD
mgnify:CR=1 FL=1